MDKDTKDLNQFTLEKVNEIAERAGFTSDEAKRAVQFGVSIAYELACKSLIEAMQREMPSAQPCVTIPIEK